MRQGFSGGIMSVAKFGAMYFLVLLVDFCAADFTSCGGFVKPSAQLARSLVVAGSAKPAVDFSHISVNLFTLDGVLKDSVTCGPHGYYLIPVYDVGRYYLSVDGPQGWAFDTKVHRVEIEKDKSCNNDEDLDFTVIGFSLSGWIMGEDGPTCPGERVERASQPEGRNGPAGVLVQISRLSDSEGDETFEDRTTVTGEGGLYAFPQILPGRYLLSASHPTWSISPQQITTTIGFQNKEVEDEFKVSGYDVRARVVSSGGEDPISGVEFSLHTFDPSSSSGAGALFSKARSDDGGRAVFTNIPRGCFILVPSFADQATFFEFQPTSLQVEVGHGSVVIDTPFRVVGFTVYGRVTHENGNPIQDVSILVEDQASAVTDADGFYKIEKMTTGMFDIVASKDHFYFSNLLKHHITANEPALPDMTASGYDLCGDVNLIVDPSIDHKFISKTASLRVTNGMGFTKTFASGEAKENEADNILHYPYCVQVPVSEAEYTISIVPNFQDKRKGLMFVEEEKRVRVSNTPVLGIDFMQHLPSLSGRVNCLQSRCPPSVTVFLIGQDQKRSISVNSDGTYKFENVLPTTYTVSVSPSDSTDDKQWCWNVREQTTSIGRDDVTGMDFSHEGYAVSVYSSIAHGEIVARIEKGEKGKVNERELVVKKGDNMYCVEEEGKYALEIKGNYKLPEPVYFFNTRQEGGQQDTQEKKDWLQNLDGIPTLFFNPIASRVKGEIRVEDPKIRASIDVRFAKSGSSETIEEFNVREDGPASVLEYYFWNPKSNREVVVTPKVVNSRMLLYPSSTTIQIKKELDSSVVVPQFSAREGIFIEGEMVPSLGGVHIEILDQQTKEVVTSTTSDGDGKYHVGPLYDSKKYEVAASKPGYHIEEKPGSKYNFLAKRLASVNVHVVDSVSDLTLDGVILSLSGMSYRSNNLTNAHGTLEFLNLSPGFYFLKPMLKEYRFDPPQLNLEIEEGTQRNVSISAIRTEYSCFGKVTSLNHQPLSRVVVEAKSENDYEETQTDTQGEYRLRGLAPGSEYTISLKGGREGETENEEIQYNIRDSVPSGATFECKKEDHKGVDFIGFGTSNLATVAGYVTIDEEYKSSVKIEMFQSKGTGLQLMKEITVHAVNYFEAPNLPLGTYVLKMTSSLPRSQFLHSEVKEIITLEKGDEFKLVELKMSIGLIDDFTESTVLPYPCLFILIFIAYCAYNYKRVAAFLQDPQGYMEEKKEGFKSFLPNSIHDFKKRTAKKTKK